MKRLFCSLTAAVMLLCSASLSAAAENTKTDVLDQVKFSVTSYSVFSDALTQPAFEMDALFTEPHEMLVHSQEDLQLFLGEYLKDEPMEEFIAQYPETFFDNYTLLLCTYLDPTGGRMTGGHKLTSAYIEDENLYLGYTANFSASICKTYCFDIMQAAVPNRVFYSGGYEWRCTETLDPGLVRFHFLDADTGKALKIGEDCDMLTVIPIIGYYDRAADAYLYEDLPFLEFSYDWFWDGSKYLNADVMDFMLGSGNLPAGWTLPADSRTVTRYDNGSMDVTFRLRRDIPEAGMLRVWLRDADTGELVIVPNENGYFGSIGTDIRFNTQDGEVSTGPILMLDANPCTMRFDLMFSGDYYAYRLSEWDLPRGYSCDAVYATGVSIPEGAVKVTRYDNGSADLTFYLKFTPSGDVSGDGVTDLSDAVSLQRWLLGDGEVLADWKAADYNNDNRLTALDLTLLLRAL